MYHWPSHRFITWTSQSDGLPVPQFDSRLKSEGATKMHWFIEPFLRSFLKWHKQVSLHGNTDKTTRQESTMGTRWVTVLLSGEFELNGRNFRSGSSSEVIKRKDYGRRKEMSLEAPQGDSLNGIYGTLTTQELRLTGHWNRLKTIFELSYIPRILLQNPWRC